jgi:hypothetical protein
VAYAAFLIFIFVRFFIGSYLVVCNDMEMDVVPAVHNKIQNCTNTYFWSVVLVICFGEINAILYSSVIIFKQCCIW